MSHQTFRAPCTGQPQSLNAGREDMPQQEERAALTCLGDRSGSCSSRSCVPDTELPEKDAGMHQTLLQHKGLADHRLAGNPLFPTHPYAFLRVTGNSAKITQPVQ